MRIPMLARHILLALLGLVLVAGTAFFTLTQLRLHPALSDVLPAEKTVVYWEYATAADIAPWVERFPALASMPPASLPFSAAVVLEEDGHGEWFMVPAVDDPLSQQTPPLVQDLRGLSTSSVALVKKKQGSLSQDPDFRALWEEGPGAFVRLAALGIGENSDSFLDAFGFSASCCGWLLALPGGFSYTWAAETVQRPAAVGNPFITLSPAPTVTLAMEDLASFIESVAGPDTVAERARLKANVAAAVGTNVSTDYDILPILRSSSVVRIHSENGRWERLLAEGRAGSQQQAATLIERLHAGATAGTESVVEDIVHEGEIQGSTVRAGGTTDPVTEERQGWMVRMTGGSRGMFTALRGAQYIVGNDRGWFEQRLAEDDAQNGLPRYLADAVAMGTAQSPLRTLALPFLPTDSAPLEWSIRLGNGVWTLTMSEER